MPFRPLYTLLSTFVLHTIEFTVDPKWSHHAVEHSTVCMFKDLHFRETEKNVYFSILQMILCYTEQIHKMTTIFTNNGP